MNIPNGLSVFRILLIPIFLIVFLSHNSQPYFIICAFILLLSGLTDMLDGYIARKYNMTSELGKILDPLADKLTQISILAALVVKQPKLIYIAVIFIAKEFVMLVGGLIILKRKIEMAPSKWFGKIGTVLFYVATFVIVAFPNLLYETAGFVIVAIVTAYTLFALIMYIPEYFKLKNKSK